MSQVARPTTLVIVNPAAARVARIWQDLRGELIARGIHFDEHLTTAPGDAETRTRHALRIENYETVIATGGDGTLSETAAGFFTRPTPESAPQLIRSDATLAILPAGTGDDFARGLLGTRAPAKEWLERFIRYYWTDAAARTVRRVDVLDGTATLSNSKTAPNSSTSRFICINGATLGIGAEVATRVARQGQTVRRLGGEARFALAALGALARWRARPVSITVDDARSFEVMTNLLAVMNGRFAGGGMMFAPTAAPDDGKLEAVTTDRLTRPVLLRELTRIHRGGHTANPRVRITSGTRVRIETAREDDALLIEADGDVRGVTPLEFRVLPRVLRVIT